MKFEHMYKKKLEFEYAKILIEKYTVKQNHFWTIIILINLPIIS